MAGRSCYIAGLASAKAGNVDVHYVEHGAGQPVLVLHGAGVDHHEAEACFEPAFSRLRGFRRIHPDLPGRGRTPAPETLRSADDVLDSLVRFAEAVCGLDGYPVVGHSAGAHYAQAMAGTRPERMKGLAMVCPLPPGMREIPEHRAVVGGGEIGDDVFRSYFVVQTPEMLERYERYVAPAAALADWAALGRIGECWEFTHEMATPYAGPTLVVAGRQDSTVGYAASMDVARQYPQATLALLAETGHALPHEKAGLLQAPRTDWAMRVGHRSPG